MTMKDTLESIASRFAVEGRVATVSPLGQGFINRTYFVTLEGSDEPVYILQAKNHLVFPDVPAMMDNIDRVTRHIKAKSADPLRETLTIIPTLEGSLYYKDEEGNYWAMCLYIKGTVSPERADTPELAYQGGLGLGTFHKLVSDFDEPLAEVIKGFHNMRFRFSQWDEALAADRAGRVKDLAEEISWIESRRAQMMDFQARIEDGTLPRRVCHNDTKISNFLFDANDGSLVCAIDLDTVMSGSLMNDLGDAYRAYTNTGAEDERDLDKVSMSMDMFKAYTEGYMSVMKDALTGSEKENIAFSALFITFEQVLRFLMDYIDGDRYYRISSPDHNLIRARAQYKLLTSMEEQLDAMKAFVRSLC